LSRARGGLARYVVDVLTSTLSSSRSELGRKEGKEGGKKE
jgi:hypothetical protein